MPRPGPRPYECVRRAWHSDRHQPMRGSIIQQIFRVVHGRHTSGTKKNREWQEKLPCVVLKAEEIMYSKANSEAEYMDLETLWDRVNEAINTIIRRDESTESGDLLPPCVEAALNLGCVPVRASRSQRHNTPRSYLSVRTHESGCLPPTNLDTSTNQQSPTLPPLHSPNPSPVERPVSTNFTCSVSESSRQAMQKDKNIPTPSSNFPSSYKNFPFPDNSRNNHHVISVENNASVNVGCVYPLYSGTHFQPRPTTMGRHPPKNSNTIIVGTPIFQSITEPAEMGCLQNFFYRDGDPNALNKTIQADFRDNHEKAPDVRDCDLSLRLGLSSAHDAADIGPSGSHYSEKLTDISPPRNKEFSFFPTEIGNEPFGFSTRNMSFKAEDPNGEEAIKKRKAPYNENVENDRFFWQPESSSNQISSRLKRPGL